MSDTIFSPTLLVAYAGLVSGYLALRKSRSRQLPLPPGPPSYPIIGQLLSMPRSSQGRAFMNMSAQLNSDIISYSVMGTTIIVLNSSEAANDLLDKRSSIHSGRFTPHMMSSPQLLNMKDFVAFMQTNDLWKKQRRVMGARLGRHAVTAFRASQEKEVGRLLARLLSFQKEPVASERLNEEFYRTSSGIFLETVYGYELKDRDDPFFKDILNMNAILSQASMPTAFLVNAFPWMEHIPDWVPGTGWKQIAYKWRDLKDRAMCNVYEWTKQRIISGADDNSIVSLTYTELRQSGWSDADADEFCKNTGTGLLAGRWHGNGKWLENGESPSTNDLPFQSSLTMLWFVLAMAVYPEVQEKAQREIDAIVGTNRLPTLGDRENLPYIERLLTEIVRWHPTAPLGVPHVCTQENEYRGYRIPKGAIIIGHTTAIVRDERVYQNADKFDPDRYMDPTVPPPQAFGWGQRICPGQHFFRDVFYLEVALILAAFNIERCKDENGNEIVPSEETTSNSAIACPVPFKVKLTPRSEQHAELIRIAA
ncbi:unnamed protein product [Rhizoctonia solani]|uniref:O-methylsterigmatocystin oxidoreductase n=1 Tax=Rhizoctonia solani TaxID=456999 RepID=A0A8H3D8P1_9AGAM|nr:unnamed protein product [Rhizoctonia solani]